MKTLRIGIVVLGLFLSGGASAEEQRGNTVWDGFSGFLQPDWERDFSATLGVKVWVNEWRRDSFFENSPSFFVGRNNITVRTSDTKPSAQTSDIEATPIPQLSFKYKWLLLTGSYYSETDFDFDTTTRTADISVSGAINANFGQQLLDTTEAERYEWDAAGGIYVHPYVAILGGYKKIHQDIEFTSNVISLPDNTSLGTNQSKSDIDVEGPIIGIASSVPIGRGVGIYLSYSHGFMDAQIRDIDITPTPQERANVELDASYDVAEGGFSYTHGLDYLPAYMPLSAATLYAGYRWQNFETESISGAERSDTTRGFVAGVNLVF